MMKHKRIGMIILALVVSASAVGCSVPQNIDQSHGSAYMEEAPSEMTTVTPDGDVTNSVKESTSKVDLSAVEGSMLEPSTMFTDRDLQQNVDLSNATEIMLQDGKNVSIMEEGLYVISGTATNVTIRIDVGKEDKVQLVLDGVSITNENAPAVTVISGDKVFVTTTASQNTLSVTGAFTPDGDINTDAVIFSKSDLVLNGVGTLTINSGKGNGITSKDDLKITGGTYVVTSYLDAFEANDAILIYDGNISIDTKKDGLHSENKDDLSLGIIYIRNGTLSIKAGDDAIRGSSIVQIDGGLIEIESCVEGIEATTIQVNGGEIVTYATDDGINATRKANGEVLIEVNGGFIKITMASGDTDAFDANGNIVINGGTIDISAMSAFDADGTGVLNGGTVTVNGEVITEITLTQGGPGGMRPGGANPGRKRP